MEEHEREAQTTKKELRAYANALIKAVCESKLDCKVEFTPRWIYLWVYREAKVCYSPEISRLTYSEEENHLRFNEMIKYLKGGVNG